MEKSRPVLFWRRAPHLAPLPWRDVLARYPQWWVVVTSVLAWAWLISALVTPAIGRDICRSLPAPDNLPGLYFITINSLWSNLGNWSIMLLAMMLPLLNAPLRALALAAPRIGRIPAMLVFLLGYLAIWQVPGSLLLSARLLLEVLLGANGLVLLAGAAFAATALSDFSTPHAGCTLPATIRTLPGWRTAMACLGFGVSTGWACMRTCWLPMAGLVIAGHGLSTMLVVATLQLMNRYHFALQGWRRSAAWLILALVWPGCRLAGMV